MIDVDGYLAVLGVARPAAPTAEVLRALHRAQVEHEVVDAVEPPGGVPVHIELPEEGATVPEDAVRGAIEDLDVPRVGDFGAIPQPSPQLANQLEDLVTVGR